MKIKISPFIYTIIFLIIFFVLYKGLQNSNIYTPNLKMEKNIPSFKAKIFVIPMMLCAILPRVLMYSLYFGSCFPLFPNETDVNFTYDILQNQTAGNVEGKKEMTIDCAKYS